MVPFRIVRRARGCRVEEHVLILRLASFLVFAAQGLEVVEEVGGLFAVGEDEDVHTTALLHDGRRDERLRGTDRAGYLHAGGLVAKAIGHAGDAGVVAVEGEEVGEGGQLTH